MYLYFFVHMVRYYLYIVQRLLGNVRTRTSLVKCRRALGTNLGGSQEEGATAFFTILPFVYALDRIGRRGSLSMPPF